MIREGLLFGFQVGWITKNRACGNVLPFLQGNRANVDAIESSCSLGAASPPVPWCFCLVQLSPCAWVAPLFGLRACLKSDHLL